MEDSDTLLRFSELSEISVTTLVSLIHGDGDWRVVEGKVDVK